ncbi:hypothetical protein CYCD_22460 [Tenuifilaceae bacterium CYCD]|nr:hypothetical protein CYCD_22460 [Tenuifilaceae bacterium CYCD]
MAKLLTQEEFIKKATDKHGNKYDFSKSIYVHSKQKIIVICKIHKKEFFISPNHLLKGVGCPDCAGTKKLTQNEFILRARQVHGNKYDYSRVIYKNYETKVEIICKEHGSFHQKPHRHLDNGGCPVCGGSNPLDTNQFIERARLVHGDRYDYSKTVYYNSKTKVEIICKEHGSFWQSPSGHLIGYNCRKCSGNDNLSTTEFIKKANTIHNNYYTYDKVEYKNANKPVTITCKLHGDFLQTPSAHLKGSECNLCSILRKKNPNDIPTSKSLTEEFINKAKSKY